MARRKTHPGALDRHGPSWRWRVSIAGERHTRIFPGDLSREEAEARAKLEADVLRRQAKRRAAGLPGSVSVSELLARFEDDELPTLSEGGRRSYADSIKPIRAYFVSNLGDPRLEEVQAAHVKGFLKWRRTRGPHGKRRKKPLSGRTLAKDRAVLHRLFALADELELREGNPVARVKPPRWDGRDPVIISEAELEALLEECLPMLRLYVLAMAELGARSESEVLWIRWEDLDLEEGFVWISSGRDGHRTKSGKGRWVPLSSRLRAAFRDHAARYRLQVYGGRRSPWIFHHTRAYRNVQPGDRIRSLRRSFRSAVKRAGLPAALVQHDLRHRRATTWLAQGANPVHVKEALGHADLRTTMGYTHLAREHLRSLVEEDGRPAPAGDLEASDA